MDRYIFHSIGAFKCTLRELVIVVVIVVVIVSTTVVSIHIIALTLGQKTIRGKEKDEQTKRGWKKHL